MSLGDGKKFTYTLIALPVQDCETFEVNVEMPNCLTQLLVRCFLNLDFKFFSEPCTDLKFSLVWFRDCKMSKIIIIIIFTVLILF